jgi:type II secretory pathway pseudopilin PulG
MTTINSKTRLGKQAGYTLLMVVFMVATMIILAAAAAPNILTQGRREKEEELVWRGQQYARAIGLYYRKFRKYPTKVEDLTKQTNGVRFLRQAYTDPMNKDDGSWRFIYVGPNGQLIGSLRATSLLQNSLSTPGFGGASPFGGGMQSPAPPGGTTNQQPGTGTPGQQANSAATGSLLDSQPQPLGGTLVGGNIIGVGSKVKKPSFRIYLGGENYEQWEFIWNPTGVSLGNPNNPGNPGAPGVPIPIGQQPPQDPQTPVVPQSTLPPQ